MKKLADNLYTDFGICIRKNSVIDLMKKVFNEFDQASLEELLKVAKSSGCSYSNLEKQKTLEER